MLTEDQLNFQWVELAATVQALSAVGLFAGSGRAFALDQDDTHHGSALACKLVLFHCGMLFVS